MYNKSQLKPDKLYSILPTVLKLAYPVKDKIILDLGCGNGFFTKSFAKSKCLKAYGIDNSINQINEAKKHYFPNIDYIFGNFFNVNYPKCHVINASFILNYSRTRSELKNLLDKSYRALYKKGKIIGVIDLPNCSHISRFGALKKYNGK